MQLTPFKQFCRQHYFELIHAAKSALALLIGYGIVRLFENPQLHQQWLLVTIAVVMGTHTAVGLQMQKAYLRFVATICGGILACIALSLPFQHITTPIMLAITGFVFMYIAVAYDKYTHIGILGVVTFCIIVLAVQPSFHIALDRTFETIGGILIAVLVSTFVFPIHIEKVFTIHLFNNLSNLQTIYEDAFLKHQSRVDSQEIINLERKIMQTNQILKKLASTPKYGFAKKKTPDPNIKNIINYARAIYRYWVVIEVTHRILNERNSQAFSTHEAAFQTFIKDIIQFLKVLSDNKPSETNDTLASMQSNQKALHKDIQQCKASEEEISALQTICFITSRLCIVSERLAHFMLKHKNQTST